MESLSFKTILQYTMKIYYSSTLPGKEASRLNSLCCGALNRMDILTYVHFHFTKGDGLLQENVNFFMEFFDSTSYH